MHDRLVSRRKFVGLISLGYQDPAAYLYNDASVVVWKWIQHIYLKSNNIFYLYIEYFISVFKKDEYLLFLMIKKSNSFINCVESLVFRKRGVLIRTYFQKNKKLM